MRLGVPSCFAVHTILLCHLTGVFIGTLSSTPILTSLSRPSRTASCQCRGTAAGLWQALGYTLGSTFSVSGGLPFSVGILWRQHVLKDDARYLSLMYCSSLGMFATVGSHGSEAGSLGGSSLVGQLQLPTPS